MRPRLVASKAGCLVAVACAILLAAVCNCLEDVSEKRNAWSCERKYPGCTAWPAYRITRAEFEIANGSIPAGWKADWEASESGSHPYSVTAAIHALLELKSLVVDDPWGYTKNWAAEMHPCGFSQVLCNRNGVVVGVDLGGMAPKMPSLVRKRSAVKQDTGQDAGAGKLRGRSDASSTAELLVRETYEVSEASVPSLRLARLPEGGRWQELGLMSLTTMRFDNARIDTAAVPASWGEYPHLKEISLGGCSLKGPLPIAWSRLATLKKLTLSDNELTGSLPQEWSAMERLEELDISLSGRHRPANRLSGELPSDWQFLNSLQTLDLWNQGISGPLPATWGSMPALEIVSLSGTDLSGSLPESWGDLANLTTLHLADTKISGKLPGSWGRLVNLTWFDVRGTAVARGIPSSWSAFCSGKKASGVFPSFAYFPWNGVTEMNSRRGDSELNMCVAWRRQKRWQARVAAFGICMLSISAFLWCLRRSALRKLLRQILRRHSKRI